jgi:flagellar basal-body rod modification protein FlgD
LADTATNVTIEISDASGNVVRTITFSGGTSGTNTFAWYGLDDSGTAVADGTYTYTVSADNGTGSPVAAYHTYRGDDGEKEVVVGQDITVTLDKNGGEIFSEALKALSEIIAALKSSLMTPTI